ncbi:hypothetical protein AJ79_07138 [Helicocarpus griseus UAMH5409]|uniref:CRAL-TRIO domain-containing protein n=1 Tax=Helicocarpus griseus UAMH5409 TaxID=1447875 RepID=A0A2B7X698_9EURO|nr:hypothetical protein AJ79_07138 [Helicocarpus griseus UAMH5409]
MTLSRTSTNRSNRSRHSRHSSSSHSHSHSHAHPQTQQLPPVTKTKSFEAAAAKASTAGAENNSNDGPDPLLGHLNHLSPQQTEALRSFKSVLIEKKLYSEASGDIPASHDDSTLLYASPVYLAITVGVWGRGEAGKWYLDGNSEKEGKRFLRARRFEVKGAVDQFQATEEWRKTNQINDLYENFDVDSYEEARRVYPQWTGRRDRRGIPIFVFVIKNLNSKNMAAYSASSSKNAPTHGFSKVPGRLLRLFALYENMVRFTLPLCSSLERPHPETPIVNTTNIVDISGVGLKQFWNLKGHMQDASVLATAHYPETLDRIFIIGAPSFFPTVWGWIKRWFDPVTTSKIFILSASEVKPTLSTFMDPCNIPKQYGGELEWEWGDMPSLDEPAKEVASALSQIGERGDKDIPVDTPAGNVGDTRKQYVKGPVVWKGDEIEVYGTIDGAERRRTIAVPKKQLVGREGQAVTNGVDAVTAGVAEVRMDNEQAPEAAAGDKAAQVATTA